MEIKQVTPQLFQDFLNKNQSIYTTFLQTENWGKLQESLGHKTLYLTLKQNNETIAASLLIKIKTKIRSFFFIPHGPIFKLKTKVSFLAIKKFLEFLKILGQREKIDFIRLAPILENNQENKEIFKNLGFIVAPIYMHAETTWVLPLTESEDEILKRMRKTTRYLIRKAIRDGVILEKRVDEKAVDLFYNLYLETAKREKFTPFTKEFISKEFKFFKKTNQAMFLFAKNQYETNQYLASALIVFTKSAGFYHQGASVHSKIPASYLVQWKAIQEAKKRGCQYYNFWGIYDEVSKRTPKSWQGLTLFKTGFGGKVIRYLPTQDYPLSPKYYLSYLWEKFLFWKRSI